MTSEKLSTKDMFLRGIAILGLLAVLLLGAWGIIQIALALPGFFGNVGGSITSVFHRETSPAATTTTVVPVAKPVQTEPAATSKPAQSKPTSTYVSAGNRTNLWGWPDLAVRPISSVVYGNRAVLQFEVINQGTNVARAGWSFNATLPIQGSYNMTSGSQQALYPGDRIVYTLGFDTNSYGNQNYGYDNYNRNDNRDYRSGNSTVSIYVDPYNYVFESNEVNNVFNFGY